MNTTVKRLLIVLGILVVSIGVDQWSKHMATTHLANTGVHTYLGDTFRLVYAKNTGAFMSAGANLSENLRLWILKVFPVLMLTVLFFYVLFAKELNRWQVIAFSFILGGGISNIYDRLLYGEVTDFMNMGIGTLRTGIFNVADMSIMLGLFMMIPFMLKPAKSEETTEKSEEITH